MSETRRQFLTTAAAAAALSGAASSQEQRRGDASAVRVPTMQFGKVEISRLVLGTNPFYGYSHFNRNLDHAMRQWYTPDKICEVMRRCAQSGINAFNYVNVGRAPQDMQKFYDEGGKIHMIAQIVGDPVPTYKQFKPLAMYNQGEEVDKAYLRGDMESVHTWCKKARDLGCLIGVGTHKPDVIAYVEDHGWDVDFYAGSVYHRTRTPEQWKQLLNGEIQEMPQETYLRADPGRMYRVMRQTKKPCFAFKILAAGRIIDTDIEQAFRTAFESLKPIDGVFVGMWPYRKDEIKENIEIVSRILEPRSSA